MAGKKWGINGGRVQQPIGTVGSAAGVSDILSGIQRIADGDTAGGVTDIATGLVLFVLGVIVFRQKPASSED